MAEATLKDIRLFAEAALKNVRLFNGVDEIAEFEAAIRREARQRCIAEFKALRTGTPIESGVGIDVSMEYTHAVALLTRLK